MVFGGGEEVARFYATIGAETSGLTRGAALARAEMATLPAAAGTAATGVSRSFNGMGLAIGASVVVGAASAAIQSATAPVVSYETAWTGVKRTVEGTDEEMANLDEKLRGMATSTLPVTRDELARIAQIGGQLGLAVADIPNFVDTVVRTSVSTNGVLGTDEAALALGRLAGKGLLDMPIDQLDELGSAILKVGDESKANEQEVVDFLMRLSGSGRLVGMTREELIGLSAVLPSLGIQAELGGTAMSNVWLKMQEHVTEGGKKLELMASIAGVSSEEFATMWRDNAGGAFALFLEGVNRAGPDVAMAFDTLEFGGVRATETLLKLSRDTEEWRRQTEFANQALVDGQKILEDSGAAFGTTAAQAAIFRNNVTELKDELGEPLIGALNFALPHMTNFAQQLKGLFDGKSPSGWVQGAISTIQPLDVMQDFNKSKGVLGDLAAADAERAAAEAATGAPPWWLGPRDPTVDAEGAFEASRGTPSAIGGAHTGDWRNSDDEFLTSGSTVIVEGDVNFGLRPDIPGGIDGDAGFELMAQTDFTSVGR